MSQKPTKIIASQDLTSSQIPILLSAYKHGLYISPHENTKFRDLEKMGYIGYHHENYKDENVHIVWLEPKAAKFIDAHFFDILEQTPLLHTYPIIRRGDIIEIIDEVANTFDQKTLVAKKIVTSPSGSTSLDKGLYIVQTIDSTSVMVTDDMAVPYRLRLDKIKKTSRFVSDELGDEDDERRKRFGKIRIKPIVERLHDRMNALKMVELIDMLYEMPHTKDRIDNE